jgi:hypothetical protein
MHTNFLLESLKRRDILEDLDIDWRKILKSLGKVVWERVDGIHLAQDRDQ